MYDIEALREEFPVLSEVIYLDSAATSQTPVRSVEAICEFFYSYAANYGRGTHRLARETTARCEESREILASFLGAYPEQMIWTPNTTSAINLLARGIPWRRGDEVICSDLEHHSNLLPWISLKNRGVKVKSIRHAGGYIDADTVSDLITGKTRVVAVTQMTNVFGTVQPVREIAEVAHDAGAVIAVDGAQSLGHLPVDIEDIDYLAIAGHKGLLGPQGTGALYADDPETLDCSLWGGGMVSHVSLEKVELRPAPARFEPGTPNIPGIIGLGPAIGLVEELGVEQIHAHELDLGTRLYDDLTVIEGVELYSPRGTAVVSFGVAGMHPDFVGRQLDARADICVRSGMHCAEPLSSSCNKAGTVRASVACYNTHEEIRILADTLKALIADPGIEPGTAYEPEPDPWDRQRSRCP
ncbi:MAG TPA: cysteine desulfurase [Methanospirillum sp.]|nr:cysteine desulfurase [Methanospirillum sp.]